MLHNDKARNDFQLFGNALNEIAFKIDLAYNSFGRFTLAADQVGRSSGDHNLSSCFFSRHRIVGFLQARPVSL